MSNLIELNNVSKTYRMRGGDVHALRDVTLDIGQGEFVSIVGTSGSGKSTMLVATCTGISPQVHGPALMPRYRNNTVCRIKYLHYTMQWQHKPTHSEARK